MKESKLLMIEPVAFGYNPQTSIDNYFQNNNNTAPHIIQKRALSEFQNLVEILNQNNIDTLVIKDTQTPHTPDSIFPNNWISFHENNTVIIYPMFAPNRRQERRLEILEEIYLDKEKNIIDFSYAEKENRFLEGTGSIVLDRVNKIAFASISQRTNLELFKKFCEQINYHSITFHSFGKKRDSLIYHTNVMMSIADNYVVICGDSITDKMEKEHVYDYFNNKEIIEISLNQMFSFVGNCLQVINTKNEKILLMSNTAYKTLTKSQKCKILKYNKIITAPLYTIEYYGGGSIRCMLSEIFY